MEHLSEESIRKLGNYSGVLCTILELIHKYKDAETEQELQDLGLEISHLANINPKIGTDLHPIFKALFNRRQGP